MHNDYVNEIFLLRGGSQKREKWESRMKERQIKSIFIQIFCSLSRFSIERKKASE